MSLKSCLGTLFILSVYATGCISDCGNEVTSCKEGYLLCDGDCFDPATSKEHCGRCFNTCDQDLHCIDGECGCLDDDVNCDGECANLEWSDDHCGECGKECEYGEVCVLGCCRGEKSSCEDFGLEYCSGDDGCPICVNTKRDPDHCGECDITCTLNEMCVKGVCVVDGCYRNEDCAEDAVCLNDACHGIWGLTYRLAVEQVLLSGGCGDWDMNSCPDLQACFFRDVEVFPGSLDTAEFCTSVVLDTNIGRWPDEPFETVLLETDDWTFFVLDWDNDGWDVIRDDFRLNPIPIDSIHFGSILGVVSDIVISIEPISE